jgi:phosphoribosylanthranilate isomerase
MQVKICGITRPEDAEQAVSLGAWALGFILWPQSKRAADPGVAAGIARELRRRVELVGVFVNQPLDEIERYADALGLSYVQLHGDEGPSFCAAVAQRTGLKVIKAAKVRHAADLRDLERFHTDLHLLDAHVPGMVGGTGQTWDWSLLAGRRSKTPFLLSGGLTPDNVAEAIAGVQPWGVDVASGTEVAPGVKDPDTVGAFLAAAGAEPRPATAAGRGAAA